MNLRNTQYAIRNIPFRWIGLLALLPALVLLAWTPDAPPSKGTLAAAADQMAPATPATAFASLNPQSTVLSPQSFAAAAGRYEVPVELLLAIAYQESRWQPRNGVPSADHG